MNIKFIAIPMACVFLAGCADSKVEGTERSSESPAAFAETDVVTDMVVSESGVLEPQSVPEIKKVDYSPNAINRLDTFIAQPVTSTLPNTPPDPNGVTRKPISDSGQVVLKPSKYAPSETASYLSEERKVDCSDVEDNYYCSDAFMLKVQTSQNTIELSSGGRVVLAEIKNKSGSGTLPSDVAYSLVYVKNNTVYPTTWFYTENLSDSNNSELRFARVKGDACIYGDFYTIDNPDEFSYVCFKESPDGLEFPDTEAVVFSEQTYDKPFTKLEIEKLSNTSYPQFNPIVL